MERLFIEIVINNKLALTKKNIYDYVPIQFVVIKHESRCLRTFSTHTFVISSYSQQFKFSFIVFNIRPKDNNIVRGLLERFFDILMPKRVIIIFKFLYLPHLPITFFKIKIFKSFKPTTDNVVTLMFDITDYFTEIYETKLELLNVNFICNALKRMKHQIGSYVFLKYLNFNNYSEACF